MGEVGRITKRWTNEEDLFVKNNYGNMTCSEIGEKLMRTKMSVRKRLEFIGLSKSPNKYSYKKDYFKTIDSEHKAYWLGFLSADGCIVDTNKGSKRVQLILKEDDRDHLEKLVKCIDGNMPITLRKQTVNGNVYGSCRLVIHSTEMANDLIKHGVTPRKTFTIKFPDISEKLIPHYIRGLIDGDGSLYINNKKTKTGYSKMSIELLSASEEHINGVKDYFDSIGVISNVYDIKNHYHLMACSMESINIIIDTLYKNSTIYLERKYEKSKAMKNLMPSSLAI